jgi:hypothetical protein
MYMQNVFIYINVDREISMKKHEKVALYDKDITEKK